MPRCRATFDENIPPSSDEAYKKEKSCADLFVRGEAHGSAGAALPNFS